MEGLITFLHFWSKDRVVERVLGQNHYVTPLVTTLYI